MSNTATINMYKIDYFVRYREETLELRSFVAVRQPTEDEIYAIIEESLSEGETDVKHGMLGVTISVCVGIGKRGELLWEEF